MIRPIAEFSLKLSHAAQLVEAQVISEARNEVVISGVTQLSSTVEPGDLFIAAPGRNFHGADFILQAKQRGAVAIITDAQGGDSVTDLPKIIVSDAKRAGAHIAASLYQNPTRDLMSIGITGTNGKTTVSTLLHQIFTGAKREAGLIGTIENRIGAERIPSARTTPEAPEIQAITATMRERHMRHLVMEVSSHALALGRMTGTHFAIAAFTNLSQDHLDFHQDMNSYFNAKAKLFTTEYADASFINIDNEYGAKLAGQVDIPTTTVSRRNPVAQWHYTSLVDTAKGFEFSIRGTGGILIESSSQLFGGFNADNLLLALAIAYECGIDPVELAMLAPTLTGAAGRLDALNLGQPYRALVDYAHSPDAVKSVLAAAREFTAGQIIAVLGCGGDRDPSKRQAMGAALASGSDIAIFTSDNPRSEDPAAILLQMTEALTIKEPSKVILDRAEAIRYAVEMAEPGDSVLILGKGHEEGQEIAGMKLPFNDKLILAQAIESHP